MHILVKVQWQTKVQVEIIGGIQIIEVDLIVLEVDIIQEVDIGEVLVVHGQRTLVVS